MKDERNHHGAMDKPQQICILSVSIFCIVRKNWLYPPTASGSYSRQAGGRVGGWAGGRAGRQAGIQAGR